MVIYNDKLRVVLFLNIRIHKRMPKRVFRGKAFHSYDVIKEQYVNKILYRRSIEFNDLVVLDRRV